MRKEKIPGKFFKDDRRYQTLSVRHAGKHDPVKALPSIREIREGMRNSWLIQFLNLNQERTKTQ